MDLLDRVSDIEKRIIRTQKMLSRTRIKKKLKSLEDLLVFLNKERLNLIPYRYVS